MVWLFSVFEMDVQVAASFVGECLEELFNQPDTEVTHHGIFVVDMIDEGLAVRKIERDTRERLVHR